MILYSQAYKDKYNITLKKLEGNKYTLEISEGDLIRLSMYVSYKDVMDNYSFIDSVVKLFKDNIEWN